MTEPVISEIDKINTAQRELDIRKAEIMLEKIGAVEAAMNSTAGKNFIAALRTAAEGMVESASRTVVMSILTTLSSATMSMQFDKTKFETALIPEPTAPVMP